MDEKKISDAIDYWKIFKQEAEDEIKKGKWTDIFEEQIEPCEMAIEALEKQIPKEPKRQDNRCYCPKCGHLLTTIYGKLRTKYCDSCGQLMKRGE